MSQSLNIVKNKLEELPNNIEAEQSVIGSILLSNEIFDEVNILITSKNFYDPMHQKIFYAIESLIYKGMLANPITLKNHFENEKDELNIPEYLVKITKFSTSSRQSIEYSKLIYDLYVKRELIKISDNIIDVAKLNDLNNDGKQIIETYKYINKTKKGLILKKNSQIIDLIKNDINNNDYLMIKGSNSTGLNKLTNTLKKEKINAL